MEYPLQRMQARESGFSLIELMVSLVIIGVLAALAIPYFLGYRVRSAQTEAKANLGALRIAELAYYAENQGFTDDLTRLAWRPEGNPRYLYGFTSDATPEPSGANDSAELAAVMSVDYSTLSMVLTADIPLTEADLPEGSVVNANGFLASAVANLDADFTLDTLTIDHQGSLTVVLADASN